MSEEGFQERIDDRKVEGWKVSERQDNRVIMKKADYGTLGGHLVVVLLTGWWTFGIGNLAYLGYRYWKKSDTLVIRAEDVD